MRESNGPIKALTSDMIYHMVRARALTYSNCCSFGLYYKFHHQLYLPYVPNRDIINRESNMQLIAEIRSVTMVIHIDRRYMLYMYLKCISYHMQLNAIINLGTG